MNSISAIKNDPNWLFVISQILIVSALLTGTFPILSFIAFVPLFSLLDKPNGFRNSYRLIGAVLITGLVVCLITSEMTNLNITIYLTGTFCLFWIFAEVQGTSPNVLNKFALVIFMLGAEYIIVKFVTAQHEFFLADLLQYKQEWTRWNTYTGYLGSSFWILIVNLIFYQAIFKTEKVMKGILVMGILLMVLPIIYSLNLLNQPITKMDMILFYAGEGSENTYARNGELISRTGAWVSVLIVIFTFVKSKTKRNQK